MRIQLENINLKFENKTVLNDLCITFEDSKLGSLLGRSGSGKTSILRIIAGISPSFEGKVIFNGLDVTSSTPQKRGVGWVPQEQLLFPGLSVKKNIGYGLGKNFSKLEKENRIKEVADLVKISKLLDRDPTYLSGGERQRVALARALAPNPKILLFDEPFSNLDAPERKRLTLLFRSIQVKTGVTTVHVTHSPIEAELISDQVHILGDGSILQSGSFSEIWNKPASSEVAMLLNIPNVVNMEDFDHSFAITILHESSFIVRPEGKYTGTVIANTRNSAYFSFKSYNLVISNRSINFPIGTSFNFDLDLNGIVKIQ